MSDSTTPQDSAAMSPASTGSLAHAWLVYAEDASESLFVTLRKEQADAAARDWGWGVAPLFVGLTQAEQDAIRLGELAFPGLRITDKGKFVDVWATLRGLVERQNRIVCDTKMDTTPAQGSVPPEWMARPFWVDPPAGHRYGFPKLYDPATDGDMTAWMVANGYPQHLADKGLACTFTATD